MNWEKLSYKISVFGFVLVLITSVLSFYQIVEVKRGISTQNIIAINQQLFDQINTGIFSSIDNKLPILIENGGKYSDYQLDNYLGIFEMIYPIFNDGYLTLDNYCSQFSYYTDKSSNNLEIQNYLKIIRQENSKFFNGFNNLVKIDCK